MNEKGSTMVGQMRLPPAMRVLFRAPVFTAAAVLTLGLGIGVNTALFSVLYAALLNPSMYPDAERLVSIQSVADETGTPYPNRMADYLDWRARLKSLDDVALIRRGESFNLTGAGDPERVMAALVTPSLFPTLRVQPLLGRAFRDDEAEPGKHMVAIVSHAFWRNRLAGRADVLSQRVELNGQSYAIVGVMPPGFDMPDTRTEIWAPLVVPAAEIQVRIMMRYVAVGRLRPDATLEIAQAEFTDLAKALGREYPRTNATVTFVVSTLQEFRTGKVRGPMLALLGTVLLVMLIACANVANLLLVRATGRRQEMAVRAALGATRLRLAREIWTEILLINAGGWIAGLVLGSLVLRWALVLAPADVVPGIETATVNAPVLLFAALLTLVTSLLIGLAPVSMASGVAANSALRQRGDGASPAARRMRAGLAAIEIAICVILLTGAALLLRSYDALLQVETGVRPDNVMTLRISLPTNRYRDAASWRNFQSRLLERMSATPQVTSAAIVTRLPFDGSLQTAPITAQGRPAETQSTDQVDVRFVSPEYFTTMGIRLMAGRAFSHSDTLDAAPTMILDEVLGRRYFGSDNALGRAVKIGTSASKEPWRTVIGIVNTVMNDGADRANRGQIYISYGQMTLDRFALVAKATRDDADLGAAMRAAVRSVDPDQAVYDVRSLSELIERTTRPRQFSLVLMALFAATALALASIGVYAVISWGVSQRTREIGVRMALGADASNVLRMVLSEAGGVALAGTVIGLAGAAALSALMKSMLFRVDAFDPAAFTTAAAVVVAATILAAVVPARRAASLDPCSAIRSE